MKDPTYREYRYICYMRSAYAIGCTIIIQYIILAVFISAIKYFRYDTNPAKVDPNSELSKYLFFDSYRIAFVSLINVVNGIYITAHFIAPEKSYASNIVWQCENLVSNFCVLGFYGLTGILTESMYHQIVNRDFSINAEICDESYLIHRKLPYVCLNGAFSSIFLQIAQRKHLLWRIPVIHQCKKMQFSSNLSRILWKSILGSGISALLYITLCLGNLRSELFNKTWQEVSFFIQRAVIYPGLTSFQIIFVSFHLHYLIPVFIAERFEFVFQNNISSQMKFQDKLSDSFPFMLGSTWLDMISATTSNYVSNLKVRCMQSSSIISFFAEFMSLNLPSYEWKPSYAPHNFAIYENPDDKTKAVSDMLSSLHLNSNKNSFREILKSGSLGVQAELSRWQVASHKEYIMNMIRVLSCFDSSVANIPYLRFAKEDLTDVTNLLLELKNMLECFSYTAISGNRNQIYWQLQKVTKRSLYRLITAFETSSLENRDGSNLDRFIKYLE